MRLFKLSLILPLLATVALILAIVGWWQQHLPLGDAIYQGLHVLSAGGNYDDSTKFSGNVLIEVARWLGVAFFLIAATKALGQILSGQYSETITQILRRDVVLVGDQPALRALAVALAPNRPVCWFAPAGTQPAGSARIVTRPWKNRFIDSFRLRTARTILVGFAGDDARTVEIAHAIRAAAGAGELLLVSQSAAALEGRIALAGLPPMRVVAPQQAAIRVLHDCYPPFLMARAAGQDRLHCLMLGCGDTGEYVIADLLLSQLTSYLGVPKVTVIDPRAKEIAASLRVRCPEIDKSLEIDWVVPSGHADPRALPVEALRSAAQGAAFTAAYVCLPSDRTALSAGLALDRFAASEGWTLGAIFIRQNRTIALGADGPRATSRLKPFGADEHLAEGLGLAGGAIDTLARELHDAYRSVSIEGAEANVDWADLPEEMREANRRVLAHIPAKLSSAGVSLDAWLVARREGQPAICPPFPDLDDDPGLLAVLASLEHERWMAERRLAGWKFASVRNDQRHHHPDLIPFDQLSERSRVYDETIVRTLAAALDRMAGAARTGTGAEPQASV